MLTSMHMPGLQLSGYICLQDDLGSCWKLYSCGMLFQFFVFSIGLTHLSCTQLFKGHIEEFVKNLWFGSDHQVSRDVPESFVLIYLCLYFLTG